MAGNYLMNVADRAGVPGFGSPGTTPYGAMATSGEMPADMAELKSVIDQLFPAQDTSALMAERERINPNAKGMGLGLGAVLLLSLLGGKKGRAGMGEAMGNFSQGFQGGDQLRMKNELDKWGARATTAAKGNELRQELFKAAMPKLLDKKFTTTPSIQEYNFAQTHPDFYALDKSKISPGMQEFVDVHGRKPQSAEEYQTFRMKPLTPIDLYMLKDLGIPVEQYYRTSRPGSSGGGGGRGVPQF